MKLEHLILGQLIQNPCTGYDIKKYLDTEGRFGMATRPLSQIYNTLKRMVKKKWVKFDVQAREKAPDRKIYTLTPEGHEYFLEYLESPVEYTFRYFESEIPWRIFFSFLIKPEIIHQQLETELELRKDHIRKYRNRDRVIHSMLLKPGELEELNAIYEKLHLYGTEGLDVYVAFLETWIKFFEQKIVMENGIREQEV